MRRSVLLFLALAAAFCIGCGGDGEGGEEAEVRSVILASTRSSDPSGCREYNTQRMLEQSTKLRGEAAIAGCEELANEDLPLPTSVNVSRIEVEGGTASARVAFEGSAYDGQTVDVALVERGGRWKLNEVISFAEFDREAMLLEWGRQLLSKADSAAEADLFACMLGRLEEFDDAALEDVLLGFSAQPVLELAQACESRSEAL